MIQEIRVISVIVIGFLVILYSCEANEYKDIKFKVRDEYLDCKGLFINKNLKEVTCFYDTGILKMVKKICDTDNRSTYTYYYENGNIKEEGLHEGDNPVGKWLTYFENGNLESVKYYEIIRDSSFIIYNKNYFENGLLESSILPLDIKLPESIYKKDKMYDMKIELKYSEFDSVNSLLSFDKNPKVQFGEDTIFSYSRVINTTFTPLKEGEIFLSGTYFEFGANVNYASDLMIAEKPFKIKINVSK